MEIGLLTFTPPLMGGDKGEGGIISPSPQPLPPGERKSEIVIPF